VRESAAIKLIKLLVAAGAKVRATDPEAMAPAKVQLQAAKVDASVELIEDEYLACAGAHALVIATEWPEYRNPDFKKISESMMGRQIYDGRNILQSDAVVDAGFSYFAIGRPDAAPAIKSG